MGNVKVEVCIGASGIETVRRSVEAAFLGGASTVELCSDMALEGLTPQRDHIIAARKAFQERQGLMVMIRPRAGNFCYSVQEKKQMAKQIDAACRTGADGVVLGMLRQGRIDVNGAQPLIKRAKEQGLAVTFHRAFDAVENPLEALEWLIEQGVDRILTSGTAWQSGKTALDGVNQMNHLVKQAGHQIEVVAAGGVQAGNVQLLLNQLPLEQGRISVHAYSGVQVAGQTRKEAVQELVRLASL